jgi:hypothetical protein
MTVVKCGPQFIFNNEFQRKLLSLDVGRSGEAGPDAPAAGRTRQLSLDAERVRF